MFTLKALAGPDPLPKGAAADFWVPISLPSHAHHFTSTNSHQATFISLPSQDLPLQTLIDNALQHLGPLLTQALIYNIGGHAARSELDKLSDPVKKLVVRQVNSKRWFEAALFGESFPSDKVGEGEKRVFLQKIVRYVNL
jgi:hypothetical protein